ncbi:GHKL domain protein [Leptospira interrogans serovar Canicola]|nr:GHKL domain protein [Leptospira interrogans serovar Canicola]
MRRSLFSKLLLSNWLLLLVLLVVAGIALFVEKFVHSDFKILLFSFYVLFAMFGTFYMSYSIAKSVVEPLDRIEKKTGEINAGDFGSELTLSDIRELADLASSINLMSTRLKNQFVDLTIEKRKIRFRFTKLKGRSFCNRSGKRFYSFSK